MKIAIGWEYGAGFGHVAMLIPLAHALQKAGHDVVLMLKDRHTTKPLWEGKGIPVMQAPFLRMPDTWDKTLRTDTLADIFVLAGLHEPRRLVLLAGAWEKLLNEVKPDLVIGEFSPTLAMATLSRIPTITVGTAYSTPPKGRPLPAIRFWDREVTERSKENEASVLDAVQAGRKSLGLPPIDYVADLFGGEDVFVCSYKELDGYAEYRETPAIGPLVAEPSDVTPFFAEIPRPGAAFFYLAQDHDQFLPPILNQLAKSGVACDGYIRQLAPELKEMCERTSLSLYDTPQSLPALLAKRGLLIHHGGMGTAEMALRLGIPQLVIPRHLEQKVNGGLLSVRLKVGELEMAQDVGRSDRLSELIAHMLRDEGYATRAKEQAEVLRAQPLTALEKIVAACCKQDA